jgi:hypothetical protein
MNDSQRLRFLAGEVAALRTFALAVSTTLGLQKLSDEFHL